MHIVSQLDRGSDFIVTLPKGKALDQGIHRNTVSEHVIDVDIQFSNRMMLVIDDELDVTSYLKEIFSPNFTVLEAFNGHEGLKLAQQYLPEIILSDINMPYVDGKQLCAQLKSNSLTCHIPIILISGQALPQNQIDGFMYGADDYVVKPFNVSLLKQKVFSILKNRELVIQHYANKEEIQQSFDLPESIDDRIMKDMNKIIQENIVNPEFTVETLAAIVGMSRSQLYRKTKAVLGQSPIEYINNMKYQKAMEMIKTGKYRVSEVAYELGFSDARYFSSSFAKKFGGSPTSFNPRNSSESDDLL